MNKQRFYTLPSYSNPNEISKPTQNVDTQKSIVNFGKDNLYPQFLISLLEENAIHGSIVERKADIAVGSNITYNSTPEIDLLIKINDLYDVIKRCIYDYIVMNNFALNIVWNVEKTKIVKIEHVDISKVRYCEKEGRNKVQSFYISNNWGDTRKKINKPIKYSRFSETEREEGSYLYVYDKYQIGRDYYPLPSYQGAVISILNGINISKFHLSNLQKNFFPGLVIKYNGRVEDPDEVFRDLQANFGGFLNAGEPFITFAEDKDTGVEIIPVKANDNAETFLVQSETIRENILTAHGITNPNLLGIRTPGQLGVDNNLINDYRLFFNITIKPIQDVMIETFNYLFSVNNLNLDLKFVEKDTIAIEFSESTLSQILTRNELRSIIGYEPITEENNNNTEIL